MQKIIISNFGPITHAEIEIKNILVLIGEQASGKSTIAKLIYFFKEIGDDFFNKLYSSASPVYNSTYDIKVPLKRKFYDYFASTKHLPDFEITYYYSVEQNRFIKLSLNVERTLDVEFCGNFFPRDFRLGINSTKASIIAIEERLKVNGLDIRTKMALEQDKLTYIRQMSDLINGLFQNVHTSSLFLVADRAAALTYETAWDTELQVSFNESLKAGKNGVTNANKPNIDIALTLKYLKESKEFTKIFLKNGGDFKEVLSNISNEGIHLDSLMNVFIERVEKIMRGKYVSDQYGEKIVFDNGQYVYLEYGSSGQKEAIRILQDILISTAEGQTMFRIIEEPESHLFPLAQKLLVESLILMKNINPHNQLIITTHSPYVLTALNNLLFASKVISTNSENETAVNALIPTILQIKPEDFTAYSLGNSFFADEVDNQYWESIFNETTGTIKQNYLDTVSDLLGRDFNVLYSLFLQSLSR
jgi:energy-coupling factor transporter ATP-binding protein EcfA2